MDNLATMDFVFQHPWLGTKREREWESNRCLCDRDRNCCCCREKIVAAASAVLQQHCARSIVMQQLICIALYLLPAAAPVQLLGVLFVTSNQAGLDRRLPQRKIAVLSPQSRQGA